MASAVDQLINGYSTDAPVSFYDYYNAYGRDRDGNSWINADPNSLGARMRNWASGYTTSAKQDYERYLAEYEYRKNVNAKQAENDWTAMREDSQVQRALKDIQAAGLNPWLALNGGSMNSAIVASQSASTRYKMREQELKEDKKSNPSKMLGTALKILLIAAAASL